MHNLFDSTISIINNFIGKIGYLGIFIGMFLESTIIPIPSELVMIPAGIASANGDFSFIMINIVGVAGNVLGALFSYYLAISIGRTLFFKIGKIFFIKAENIIKIENFFLKYGAFSVFIGRLLPGFRHFISIPAGIARMNIKIFIIFTTIGSIIWTLILSCLGYFIGNNQDLIKQYSYQIMFFIIIIIILFAIAFIFIKKSQCKDNVSQNN